MNQRLQQNKYVFSILFILCTLILGMTFAYAEENDVVSTESTEVRPAGRDMLKENREAIREEKATTRDEMKTAQEDRIAERTERRSALSSAMQDRIINLTHNVTARLTSALDRMDAIIVRIESRSAKLQSLGVDVNASNAKLSEAKRILAEAQDALSTLPTIESGIRSDTPRESFAPIRTQLLLVRDLVKQVHGLLSDTVSLLKEAVRTSELKRGVSDAVRADERDTTNTNSQ